jgi:bifunctional DNA-binding transcriptional regulator/antitoxin component of YhaV-PrlF toxin-antitoxin module
MKKTEGLVPIKAYRIKHDGNRGQALSLPKAWLDELSLKEGDRLVVYRQPDSTDLIVRAERKEAR